MTVGGRMIGSVTSASITALQRERERFNQYASGRPRTKSTNVVTAASRNVSHNAHHNAGGIPKSAVAASGMTLNLADETQSGQRLPAPLSISGRRDNGAPPRWPRRAA